MRVKVSHHAKQRANERLDVAYKAERNKLFKRALKYGHPSADFAGEFAKYLESKKRDKGVGAKVYDNNIYIYRNKTIITVFPVPDKYIPINEHFASYLKNNPLLMKLYEVVDKEDILLEIILKDKNNVTCALFIDDEFQNFGVGKTEIKAKNSAIKFYLNNNERLKEGDKFEK